MKQTNRILLLAVFCAFAVTGTTQDSIYIYLHNADSLNRPLLVRLSWNVNYPFLHSKDQNISLRPRQVLKHAVGRHELQMGYGSKSLTITDGDSIHCVFNNEKSGATAAAFNNPLLFYRDSLNAFLKGKTFPSTWYRRNSPSYAEYKDYTTQFYTAIKTFTRDFFGSSKPGLQLYLQNDINNQLHDDLASCFPVETMQDKEFADARLKLYYNLPSPIHRTNYHRLALYTTALSLSKIDTSSSMDRTERFIAAAQKYFSPGVRDYLLMLRMKNYELFPKDANQPDARKTYEALRTTEIYKPYRKTIDSFYLTFRRSLKKVEDLYNAKLIDGNGKQLKLGNVVKKGSPLVLDFWATWCGPCIREFPHWDAAAKRHQTIQFLSLSKDEDVEKWRSFVRKNKLNPKKHFLLAEADKNLLVENYAITDVPRYILFNARGECVDANFMRPGEKEFSQTLIRSLNQRK